MRYFITIIFILAIAGSFCITPTLGQQSVRAGKNMMETGVRNYKTFTIPSGNISREALQANKGYEQHPELGKLFAESPCTDCYELIGKRTEISKTYIKNNTNGKSVMQQTSNAPMHYKDNNGNWITIKTQLQPDHINKGVYAATEQEVPVTISAAGKFVSLGKRENSLQFNNNLELIFEKADGTKRSLGAADWTNHTAGDDGVYVTNAWPGIDLEVFVIRGSVKTNFWITRAMPAYATGKLYIRDHLQMDDGLSFVLPMGSARDVAASDMIAYTGNIELHNKANERIFTISAATAFEKKNIKSTLQLLEYRLNGRELDITVPGSLLNRPSSSYPVIIDPLVSQSTTSAVSGSTYSSSWTVGCVYNNPATVPAAVTVNDVQFSFQYVTSGGALLNNGAFDFKLGTCRSPTPTALFWNCNSLLSGTCTGTGASIFSSFGSCIPAPQCASYDLNATMDFYQNYASASPCANLYITAGTPLMITVFGNTIDPGPITAMPSVICNGSSTNLSTNAVNGVGPYSYVWMPGALTGPTVTVSPTMTTTYTVTATDQCSNTAVATKTIVVNAVGPITGNNNLCVGSTTTLSDAVGGGTWVSNNTSVAGVGSSSGIVSGVAAGTATISYTAPSGCVVTTTVTVSAPPAAITGVKGLCQGTTTTLSDATIGGTWSSSNTGVAIIGSTSGIVSGLGGGTAIVTYTAGSGCSANTTVTVYPTTPITGTSTVCLGGTTTLTNSVGGGTWTSSNTSIVKITSSGTVSGLSAGTVAITYTTPSGCTSALTMTVTVLTPITGIATVCQSGTTTLSNATPGGTWSSAGPSVASISSSGIVTGIASGTATISYITAGGCYATTVVTVNPQSAISGPSTICAGTTATLSNSIPGGTWSSTNTVIATISPSGVLSGLGVGTSSIKYTTALGCVSTVTASVVTVAPITGPGTVCQSYNITLSNATTGGTWASGNIAIATVSSLSGVVTGTGAGTVTISYTSGSGCVATTTATVYPSTPISGTPAVCVGSTTALSNSVPGGTWSSSNTANATIDPSTGIVSGIAAGTSLIQYTTPLGCISGMTVTVNALYPITGTTTICQGSATILSNLTPSGTWASSNTSVATITSTGSTSGIGTGTSTITYTTPGGCFTTTVVTVNALGPIIGPLSVCMGNSVTLSDATPGGAWSSTNTGVATINSSGIVSGLTAGFTSIKYTTALGCIATLPFTVNAISPITGITTICQGSSTTLSNATTGGAWTSSNLSVTTIGGSSGIAVGTGGGTSTIVYTTGAGCTSTATLTVNPLGAITGSTTVCQGYSSTLSNSAPGGTWISGNTSIATIGSSSGVITGVSNGSTVIQYTTPMGCIATVTVTVNPLTPISGVTSLCNTTTLSNATTGGAWSTGAPSIASIGASSGIVTAVSAGTATITYTTSGGCFTTTTVTVNPTMPITGGTSLCAGSTSNLANGVPGGTWTSSNTLAATIGSSTGIVSGITGGTSTIIYTTPAGCTSSINVMVFPLAVISGNTSLCLGSNSALSSSVAGGTWTSSNPGIAIVGLTSGIVSGIGVGTARITYTTVPGCLTTLTITVNPVSPVTGTFSVCQGSNTLLNNATPGGTWTSTTTTVATIDPASGLTSGISGGTSTIVYTTAAGCTANATVTVNPIGPISGSSSVCQGSTTTLSNIAGGGTWVSTNPSVATVGFSSGSVLGINAGTADIIYTTGTGCSAMLTITVDPLAPIIGTSSICAGNTSLFNNATPGGTWASSNTSVATIDGSGLASGLIAGTSSIQYTTPAGCVAKITLMVNPYPSVIGGPNSVCIGNTTTFSNALSGGTWSSSNPGSATIGLTTGIATGISASTVTISYTTSGNCSVTTTLTINPLPAAITGTTSVCVGNVTTLSDPTPGGTWSSSNPGIATVSLLSGNVSGIAAGSANIVYTSALGCSVSTPVTVFPVPGAISGTNVVCEGYTTTLTNTLAGGSWSSSNISIASVGASSGIVTGITAGTANITYMTAAGCYVSEKVTVNPTPVITGTTFTNPTTCVDQNGTITLNGLSPGTTYTLNYTSPSGPVTTTRTSSTSGQIIIINLPAGSYSNFSVTTSLGCTSNTVSGTIDLVMPPVPSMPVATNSSPICEGNTLSFTANDVTPGVTYTWTGPNGFYSTLQNPFISLTSVNTSGIYSVTATKLGCVSAQATTSVSVHVVPKITKLTSVNPKTCKGHEGSITIEGLLAGVAYGINYTIDGVTETANLIADNTGKVTINGLGAGVYSNISVTFSCQSNVVGPVTLSDPFPAPNPTIWSNSPICTGKTLKLNASDPVKDVTYEWTGPHGFSSAEQNIEIPDITETDSGTYNLTIRYLNCPSYATQQVVVYPPLKLVNVTPDLSAPSNGSVQLYAGGAQFYMWMPNDGTLSDPNIDSPVASPQELVTTYTVIGMNHWGCSDSAKVTITIDDNVSEFVPNAFSPNNDGQNDIFRVGNLQYDKLIEFNIYNRWGQRIYHNEADPASGWDGKFNGVPQDAGTYTYTIILNTPGGKTKVLKGDVILIR